VLLLRNRGVIVLVRGEPDAGRPAPCVTAWQCDGRWLAGWRRRRVSPAEPIVGRRFRRKFKLVRARTDARFLCADAVNPGGGGGGRRGGAPRLRQSPSVPAAGRPAVPGEPLSSPLPSPAPSLHRCPQPPRAVFFSLLAERSVGSGGRCLAGR